jgi:hypothetical protein
MRFSLGDSLLEHIWALKERVAMLFSLLFQALYQTSRAVWEQSTGFLRKRNYFVVAPVDIVGAKLTVAAGFSS